CGFSASSFAVLSWLRTWAVSSRRRISPASASLVAAMTWFNSVFISPGSTMSRNPTLRTAKPSSAARAAKAVRTSPPTASLSASKASSALVHRVGDHPRHDQVHTKRNLVSRDDFLTSHVGHLLAQVQGLPL